MEATVDTFMKNLILTFLFSLVCFGASVKAQIPRLSIQYGNSKCSPEAIAINNSLPDLGLWLTIKVRSFNYPYTGPAACWLGRKKTNIPFKTATGQTCYFLTYPDFVFTVPMIYGYGEVVLFRIPNHPSLLGLRIHAQTAIRVGNHESWSPGTEMAIQ